MKVIFNNEQILLENDLLDTYKIFDEINRITANNDVVFSHLLIDGIEVYEDHENYIKENINEILVIEIVTFNEKKMFWETMESIHSYLNRAIPSLIELVDDGYENFSSNSWKGIAQLAEGMQWILQFANVTKNITQKPENWWEMENSLHQCGKNFTLLLEAVESKDTILITDILSYEIIPRLDSLKNDFDTALKCKGYLQC